jgi:hypothetical protein
MKGSVMETSQYGGWQRNVRLSNGRIELVITGDVGPRIIRCGFAGKRNLFCNFNEQIGGKGEKEWMIRGGHRLWIAPEYMPLTYELDNSKVDMKAIRGGVKVSSPLGKITHCLKTMSVTLSEKKNEATVIHEIKNCGRKALSMAPWALTVMAADGMAVIPLPSKAAHSAQLLPNQEWTLWAYTDLMDKRFRIGDKYMFFSQNRRKGPNKVGILNKEGWVAYVLGEFLFVKTVEWQAGAVYPDGGVNFETYSNERMLELETLGPQIMLKPGKTVRHVEKWFLFDGVPFIRTEKDADREIRRRVRSRHLSGQETAS